MKNIRNMIVAGTVATLLAASAGLAMAVSPTTHSMTIALPDGGLADITYSGDIPPKISFKDGPSASAFPFADPAFADLRKMSADFDRQMDTLMTQMTAPGGMTKAGGFAIPATTMPSGAAYTMISTESTDGNVCTRSVEVSRHAGDKAPRVVTRTSGNCKNVNSPVPSAPTASANGPVHQGI